MSNTETDHDNCWVQLTDIPSMLHWLREANSLPGKTPTTMAIAVLRLAERLQRREHIMLTPSGLQEIGLNRTTAYRACCELEKAGLISVRRSKGCSPMVSLHMPTPTAKTQ